MTHGKDELGSDPVGTDGSQGDGGRGELEAPDALSGPCRNILQALPVGLHAYELDAGDRLVFSGYNDAAGRILGIDHQPLLGRTLEEAFPPLKDTEIPERYRRAALFGEAWEREQVDYADGAIRGAYEIHAFRTTARAMAVVFRDVTEQRRLEEQLRLSRSSLEHCGEVVFWVGRDGALLYHNEVACERLGYTHDELRGLTAFDVNPSFDEESWERFWQTLRDKRLMAVEATHRRKDGSLIPVEVMASYLEHGDQAYACAFARDISDRQRAAAELQEAHDRLEERVHERTAQLQEAHEELQQVTMQLVHSAKLAALGELTAGVAHELNQPLNAMKIICQGMLRDAGRGELSQSAMTDKLDKVVGLVDRMAAIILHMRIFTRQTRPEARRVVDLVDLLESALGVNEQQLLDSAVEVVRELPTSVLRVRADTSSLEQVFLNLLSNARWALMQQSHAPRRLLVRAGEDGPWAVVTIVDNGVGIAEDAADKIFQPFFTTREPGDGTGLGLSVSSKLVQEHGGTLKLLSGCPEGTCFEIRLPLEHEDAGF